MKFQKRKTYYPFPVYEFNLPAGHSCPFAKDCLVKVDPTTGKQYIFGKKFKCYAAVAERYPSVRESRWQNFIDIKDGKDIEIPRGATHVRIHGSGDFFAQWYFDMWLEVARTHPTTHFWAFTKSIGFWVNRIGEIPENLTLTASRGSHEDSLIDKYGLRYAEVFDRVEDVPNGMQIDTDDTLAMSPGPSFALINNFKIKRIHK